MGYIDTHCHLDLFNDIQLNVKKINDEGIKTISVTNSPTFFLPNQELFEGQSNIRVALGLHPELIKNFGDSIDLFEQLIAKTKYIGEIGLDGSKDLRDTFNKQVQVFNRILDLIRAHGNKILTIHSRNAAKKTIVMLDQFLSNTNCGIILHWFSGSLADLDLAIQLGYHFSINHKMTQSKNGKELISRIPINLLLTETDAPFTFDAIVNRQDSLNKTIDGIAEIKSLPSTEIKNTVYENFTVLLRRTSSS